MIASDFGNAIAIKSTNPNTRGSFEIDIVHNKPGKQKYRATAKVDQTREYCVVFKEVVLQCYALAPRSSRSMSRAAPSMARSPKRKPRTWHAKLIAHCADDACPRLSETGARLGKPPFSPPGAGGTITVSALPNCCRHARSPDVAGPNAPLL